MRFQRLEFVFLSSLFVLSTLAGARMSAAADCVAETAALEAVGRNVRIEFGDTVGLTAGGSLHVKWTAQSRGPLRVPMFIAVAIPGEVRFTVPALPAKRAPAADSEYEEPKPDFPGFMALSPQTRGPLGLEFGRGKSRAIVPLHQLGVMLSGTFDVTNLPAGQLPIEASVVARTACGERVVSAQYGRTLELAPGAPEIVVQDPYDIENPRQVILSNNGRYRVHVFDDRYRVFDLRTGAKVADRAGRDVNFSPTARFVVANAGSAGSQGHDAYQVVDLATGDVASTARGPFIGFAEGDAFLIDGHGEWGALSVRPTLISRPVANSADPGAEPMDDGLTVRHPGSCHACMSWVDDSFMLDFDNGILAYSGTFEKDKTPVFELASGAQLCCAEGKAASNLIAQNYAVLPIAQRNGWQSRTPIGFSHIYDPTVNSEHSNSSMPKQDQIALELKKLFLTHKTRAASGDRIDVASVSTTATVVRGDWRSRTRRGDDNAPQDLKGRIQKELLDLGLATAAPLDREQIPFVNTSLSLDMRTYWDVSKIKQKQIDAMIAKRTETVERRLAEDVPSAAARFGRYWYDVARGNARPVPLDDLARGRLYLDYSLQGLWRWNLNGRPVWLLQLWATEGNGGIGQGTMTLFMGDAAGQPRIGGRMIDLTKPLEAFWAGQYGMSKQGTQYTSENETNLKPQLFLNRYLVVASVAAKSIAVFDVENGAVPRIFSDVPQADLLADVILSEDARHVIQLNKDGQFFIHEIASGHTPLTGRVVDDEIIVYTREGYYWSSYEGAHFVQLRFPGLQGVFPFQQFAHVLEHPEIIKAQIASAVRPPIAPKLSPPPDLSVALGQAEAGRRPKLFITARGTAPLQRLKLFADGQLVSDVGLNGLSIAQDVEIPPLGGARWLTAQVSDANGLVSNPQAVRLQASGAPTRQLYSILVGNDIYSDRRLTLRYARHDAERLGALLQSNPGRIYARSTVKLLTDAAATPEAIRAEISRAVETATSQDTILFSFAGHGFQMQEDGRYYLTPYGFETTRSADTALAWREIADLLHKAKSRVIVILDACQAGLSGTDGLGTNDQAIGALLAGDHPPMLVLAASKGRQASFEDQKWDGGVFTYALIEALQSKRSTYDLDHDGAIEISELYRGLRQILARETAGEQTPWLVRQDLLGDFVVF